jgi:hypothetical protein
MRMLASVGLLALLISCGGVPVSPGMTASGVARDDPELKASFALWGKIWEETGDPFEARRQTLAKYFSFFWKHPVMSRNLDDMTALAWVAQGGEAAGAICYMRGFQFGTAHHDQCVYEEKMGRGEPRDAIAPSAPRFGADVGPQAGKKVYDTSECIGPVIMGRCHGAILPNKAYHPTCYGAWLNGQCTGPMF